MNEVEPPARRSRAGSGLLLDVQEQAEPAVTGRIRRLLQPVLRRHGVDQEIIEDALLVVEELVANVVDHARTRFRLLVHTDASAVRVVVIDGNPCPPLLRSLDPTARRGRGLQMVQQLARGWGFEPHPPGKSVWAELATDPPPASPLAHPTTR